MVEHAGADDLVECLAELPDPLDREPMEIEISQSIFSLQIARVAQAGLADVDCGDPCIGFTQRMNGSLGCSAAGDQDLSICPWLLRWPQHEGQCPTPIGVPIEVAVPIKVADRRRIRVVLVEGAHRVGRIGGHRCSRLLPSHMRLSAPSSGNRIGRPAGETGPTGKLSNPIRLAYECLFSCSLRSTSSRLKLAAFWRCGYSLNVCRNSPM